MEFSGIFSRELLIRVSFHHPLIRRSIIISFNSAKSTVRIEPEHDEDNYDHQLYPIKRRNHSETDLHPFQLNKAVGSFVFNGNSNNNCFREQCKINIDVLSIFEKVFCKVPDQDEKIDYQTIQMLIENLHQSSKLSVEINI